MRQSKYQLLAGTSFLAFLGAGIVLAPAASAQNINPGEPYARTPITLAQSTTEAQPAEAKPGADVDKLIPLPDTSPVPPPSISDVTGTTPDAAAANADKSTTDAADEKAPEVTVVPPEPKDAKPAANSEPAAPEAAPAATAEKPATAAPALSATDQALADKLKDLLASKASKYFDRKAEREGAIAYYKEHNYAPLWTENGQATARANAIAAYLKTVGDDGLDPSEYATPEIKPGMDADALADAELKFTDAALTFARHAATGRVSFTRISNDMYYDLKFPEPSAVLEKLASAGNAGEALAAYLPQHPAYKALRAKYAELRARKDEAKALEIGEGPLLRLVKAKDEVQPMNDPRVIALRKRLGVTQNPDSTAYDQDVADAVKKFQAERGLNADGVLGNATVRAMNGPSRDRQLDVILANLERWRWIPHDLRGDTYVMVNVPDYSLKLVRNGETYWKTRIVVGQPEKPTPLISPDMKFITVNPTWNVPPSIIAREYLPALRQDPTVLDRVGLKLEHNPDGTVRIYQPPGEKNALGRIRFNFPNKFLVYQHDTPDKYLFDKDKRAYSHGCMRVQNPLTYAEKLLSIELPNDHYNEAKIKSMLGSNEINIDFPKPLPVHITYQTAFVDDAGKLEFRDDVYGLDAHILRALKTDERRVADIAVEQKGVGSATVSRDELIYDDYRSSSSNSDFENPFFALFGPRAQPSRPDPRGRRYSRDRDRDRDQRPRETENLGFFGLFVR